MVVAKLLEHSNSEQTIPNFFTDQDGILENMVTKKPSALIRFLLPVLGHLYVL